MIEIHPRVYVGSEVDYATVAQEPDGEWAVLHCSKEPYHRLFVGYKGRGADKHNPEYLSAMRGDRMALNMVDATDPKFFSVQMIQAGLDFLDIEYQTGRKLLIHCNQGKSRGPSVAMLYVCKYHTYRTFDQAESHMQQVYPEYAPCTGIRGHLLENWESYLDVSQHLCH